MSYKGLKGSAMPLNDKPVSTTFIGRVLFGVLSALHLGEPADMDREREESWRRVAKIQESMERRNKERNGADAPPVFSPGSRVFFPETQRLKKSTGIEDPFSGVDFDPSPRS